MVLALALLAYPVAVVLLIDRAGPPALTALFAVIAGLRLLLAKHLSNRAIALGLLGIGALCVAAVALQSFNAVKLYPAGFSLAAAIWCCYTLCRAPSAIERLLVIANASSARLPKRVRAHLPLANHKKPQGGASHLEPTDAQRTYMRGLTLVWMGFFVLNAAIAVITALSMSTAAWALYTALLSYVLIAVLVGAEVLYRPFYQRRHGEAESPSA